MFELIICSLVTILPDYLYRRYVQLNGQRDGLHGAALAVLSALAKADVEGQLLRR